MVLGCFVAQVFNKEEEGEIPSFDGRTKRSNHLLKMF